MDVTELIQYRKLIPILEKRQYQTISYPLPNFWLVKYEKIRANNFLIQNNVKQNGVPSGIPQIIEKLKNIFKIKKTHNTMLTELTKITEGNSNIAKFVENFEKIVTDLNELQITGLGETSRSIITDINYKIAFNSFKNGFNGRGIIRTI